MKKAEILLASVLAAVLVVLLVAIFWLDFAIIAIITSTVGVIVIVLLHGYTSNKAIRDQIKVLENINETHIIK